MRRVCKYGMVLAFAGWAVAASADDRRFNEPRWFDERLDWCLNWNRLRYEQRLTNVALAAIVLTAALLIGR